MCCRYDSDGHLTNATFPTGEVSSFHSDVEKLTRVELDTSNRENVITATNFSATSTIYTLKQGNWGVYVISSFRIIFKILNIAFLIFWQKDNKISSFVSSLLQFRYLDNTYISHGVPFRSKPPVNAFPPRKVPLVDSSY